MNNLSKRQLQILDVVSGGGKLGDAAIALGITKGTLYVHLSQIYTQLGVKNKKEAIPAYLEWKQAQSSSSSSEGPEVGVSADAPGLL